MLKKLAKDLFNPSQLGGGLQLYIVVVSSIFYPPPSSQFQYFAPKKTFTLLIMTKSRLDLGQYWLILPDFCTLTNFVLFLANIKFWLKWPSFCPKVSEYLNFFYPSPPRCAHNYNFIHQEVGQICSPPQPLISIFLNISPYTHILRFVNFWFMTIIVLQQKEPEHLEFLGFIQANLIFYEKSDI